MPFTKFINTLYIFLKDQRYLLKFVDFSLLYKSGIRSKVTDDDSPVFIPIFKDISKDSLVLQETKLYKYPPEKVVYTVGLWDEYTLPITDNELRGAKIIKLKTKGHGCSQALKNIKFVFDKYIQ